MSKDIVVIPAAMTGAKTLKDRSVKLEFTTSIEVLDGEEVAKMFSFNQREGFLVFSMNEEITHEDIPEVRADVDLDKKSPSQRLRDVLYVYWKQKGGKGNWETFYLTHMNRLIETIKEKLEPEG